MEDQAEDIVFAAPAADATVKVAVRLNCGDFVAANLLRDQLECALSVD